VFSRVNQLIDLFQGVTVGPVERRVFDLRGVENLCLDPEAYVAAWTTYPEFPIGAGARLSMSSVLLDYDGSHRARKPHQMV
jgi:hypothetical protein